VSSVMGIRRAHTAATLQSGRHVSVHFTYMLQPYIQNYNIFVAPPTSTRSCPHIRVPTAARISENWTAAVTCIATGKCEQLHPGLQRHARPRLASSDDDDLSEPSNIIALADRRNYTEGTNTALSDKKGLSGFNPSQPCTREGATMVAPQYAPLTIKSMTYAFWTAEYIQQHEQVDTSDKDDVIRVWYDLYGNGSNYAFADGHAKFQPLGATLVPRWANTNTATLLPEHQPRRGVTCLAAVKAASGFSARQGEDRQQCRPSRISPILARVRRLLLAAQMVGIRDSHCLSLQKARPAIPPLPQRAKRV